MAGPKIDVSANVSPVTQGIDSVNKALDATGKTADRVSKKQYRPLAPGALDELREAIKLLERMGALSGNMPGAGSGQNAPAPSYRPPDPRSPPGDDERSPSGGQRRHRGRWSHYGENGTFGRFFNAFTSPLGGAASTIAGEAMAGSRGAGGFSGMGLMRGGLIGAGLFGAYKAGQMVMEGYENAKTLAQEMDKLKRQMGDIGVSFNVLSSAAEAAAAGLEINTVEAGKLMAEFNRLSGGVKDTTDVMDGTRTGVGLSKALGLDPSSGVGFLANMRNITRGGSAEGDRRLALMIGDVVARTGMNGRADEMMQAIQSFAASTSRISLTNPNLMGFSGAYAGLLSAKIPGLTPETAAALLGQANSAMMNMGAFGEASETFTLSALGRYGNLNPIQARVLSEGGLFGNRAGSFGKGSIYRQYMMANGVSESEIDKLMGANGGVTNFEAIRRQLDSMNVDPNIKAEMAKNFFGTSSISQAMALMSINPEEMGKTERMLSGRGIDLMGYNETGIMTLSKIANAKGVDDLRAVAGDMLGRTGKGALNEREAAKLKEAMQEGGFKQLQDTLADLAADKDKQETLGSQMLDQQKRIESAMTNVGKDLLGPLTDMKELLMAGFGVSENKARERVLNIRKAEIGEEYAGQIKSVDEQISMAQQSRREASFLSMLPGAPARAAESVKEWDAKLEELEKKKAAIIAERDEKIRRTQDQYDKDRELRRQVANGMPEGAPNSNASGIRNNNPGNISKTRSAWDGEVSGTDSRFKSFDTPENGIRAIGRNLLSYKSKGLTTVSKIIGTWAPPNENDTNAYIAAVAKKLGVGPDDQIDVSDPKVMRALTEAIITHENGGNPYSSKQISAGVNMALGIGDDMTPMPKGGKNLMENYPQSWGQRSLAPWDLTFKLVDSEGRMRAAPINISVPVPTSSGSAR